MYLDLAKGAIIRSQAKWLEEGEKNTIYFFALERGNPQLLKISTKLSPKIRN